MEKIKPDFDSYASSYEEELNRAILPGTGDAAKYSRIKASHLKNTIYRLFEFPRDLALLDAGCGVGLTDEVLKASFPNLAGFDVSPESLRLARQRNPEVRYEVSNGLLFPFRDQEFDLIFSICVLHHVDPTRRAQFFREAYRILRPGGFFLIYEHNPWNPITGWVVRRCCFDRDASLLDPKTCRHLFCQGGFEPREGGSLIFLPVEAPSWRRWEEKWLSRIPLGAQFFELGRKGV